jgi:hypothetical protein
VLTLLPEDFTVYKVGILGDSRRLYVAHAVYLASAGVSVT